MNTHEKYTFFVSDPHFFHTNLVEKWEARPPFKTIEEHNYTIVNNWNSVVKPDDIVWVLGDLVFSGKENLKIFEQLLGKKRLVLGNHDSGSKDQYMKYFERVEGAVEYGDGVLLTHIPVHPQCLGKRFWLNIHGHTHREFIKDGKFDLPDTRYVCVSLEQTDYFPLTYQQVLQKVKEKKVENPNFSY